MAWSVLQSAGNPSATLTATATLATNLSAGSKLVAYVCNAAAMTISTVKDTAGNSFSQVASNIVGAITDAHYIYVLDTPAGDVGAATTITATWTGTANGAAIIVQEVSGLAAGSTAAACLDGTPAKTSGSGVLASGGTSLALGAYASAAASEYLIILYADDGDTSGSTGTLPTGYTADTHNVSSSSADDLRVYFKNSTGGTEAPTTITVAGGGQSFGWTATFIAFKLAAAAGPQIPGQEARLPLIPPGMFPPGSSRGLVPQPSDPSLGPPPPSPPGAEFIPATTPLIVPPFLTPASWSQPWAPRTDPGVVPPGTPSQYRFLLALASQASNGIAHPLTLTATALAAQPAERVSLGKKISSPVTVFPSLGNSLKKILQAVVNAFSSVTNGLSVRSAFGANSAAVTTVTSTGQVTLPPGWQPGDMMFILIRAGASGETITQTAGSTFTVTASSSNSGGFTSAVAYRVMQLGDTAPTFGWGAGASWEYMGVAVTPSSGKTASLDVFSTTLVATVLANTFTPNSATAAGTRELSLVMTAGRHNAIGAFTLTYAPPSGWTVPSGGTDSYGDASNTGRMCTAAANVPVGSGSVAPGSESVTDSASGTWTANVYQILVKESGGGISNLLSLIAQMVLYPAEQVSLGKNISNPVSVFSSAQKALGKNISSPVSVFSSVKNSVAKTLAAIAVAFSATNVRIGRLISGQLAAFASVSMQKVKLLTLAAQAVASSAVTRQVSRTLSGITAVTGSVTRQALRTLAAQAAAFTTATRRLLRTLPGQAAVTGTSQSKTGRLLSGVAAATAGTARQAGKGISGVTATAGTVTRSITRTLNAVSAVLSSTSLIKVKLLALVAQVAATGAEKISLGKILSGITAAYSSLQNSLGKRISGTTTITGSTIRGTSRLLSGVTAASGIITIVKVKLLTLVAQVAAYSAEKISLGKAVQAVLAAFGTAQSTLRRNMTISAIAVTTGTAVRSLGKNLSGITTAFPGISSIKVKLLTLAAQVVTLAGTTRKISPVISAQVTATGVTIRSASRKIAAQAVLTGLAVNSLGKKISGTAVAFSSAATQKIRPLVLSALAAVTNAVTRRIGSIQPGTLVTAPSVTRRVTRKIAAAMAANSTVIAGRAFLVKLTAITATSASVVVKISQSAFVIAFKLGTPVFRWITGGLKKVWRIP